jgi:hypothetical protein
MKKLVGTVGCILVSMLVLDPPASYGMAATRHHQNCPVTFPLNVDSAKRLADSQSRAREFAKIPLEVYRNRQCATEAQSGALQPMPAIDFSAVAASIFVAPPPQSRFKMRLYAQSHRTLKLEK